MIKICKYCEKEIECEKWQSYAAHVSRCNKNPNYINTLNSIKESKLKLNPINEYQFNCIKCGEKYKLQLKQKEYNRGSYKKHCSHACANSHIIDDKQKEKTSNSLKERKLKFGKYKDTGYNRKCKCGEPITVYNKTGLCKICIKNDPGYKLRLSKALKGKTGGYRVKSGTSKFHGSYYNNVWMDSSWELEFAKRLDLLNIKWDRSKKLFIKYNIDNQDRKYYPDFYLSDYDLFIEIKGFYTTKFRQKIAAVLSQNNITLKIIDKIDNIRNWNIN
jgi:hypothetical protein